MKSPEISQYPLTDARSVYSRNKGCNLETAWQLLFLCPKVLLTFAITSMTIVGISQKTVIAQTSSTSELTQAGVQSISQVRVLFVNPNMGDDTAGNGLQKSPFRTITQAVDVAQPNTTIVLSRGNYSAETGEKFPVILKSGVSLQGDPQSKGRGIVIQGGGDYLSRFFGRKNTTLVAANQSTITGVTVINSNFRGYGLWIESGSPQINNNTFTGSTQDGLAVTGRASPNIEKNNFSRNGANGITVSGNSQPKIRENVLQQTGFGISVANNAQPLIIANSIQYNRSGLIIQANSRPVLRNNLIQGNKEDGLVAIYQSMPDLGNAREPGGNKFIRNGRYDINASAAKQTLMVYGNNLGRNKITGEIDFSGSGVASAITNPTPIRKSINDRVAENSNSSNLFTSQLPSIPIPTRTRETVATKKYQTPPSRNLTSARSNTSNESQLNYVQIDNKSIEFTAPKLATPSVVKTNRQVRRRSLPVLETAPRSNSFLPVPGANVPGMDNGNIISQTPGHYGNALALSTPNNSANTSRYRVMARIQAENDREIVRFLAPDAFPTIWQGRAYMQAGVFSSRYNASNMQKILNSNGLTAIVQPVSD